VRLSRSYPGLGRAVIPDSEQPERFKFKSTRRVRRARPGARPGTADVPARDAGLAWSRRDTVRARRSPGRTRLGQPRRGAPPGAARAAPAPGRAMRADASGAERPRTGPHGMPGAAQGGSVTPGGGARPAGRPGPAEPARAVPGTPPPSRPSAPPPAAAPAGS
jgi:hypothetical protein